MIVQLLSALGLTCVTVLIHALGTWVAIVHLARVWSKRQGNRKSLATGIQIVRVVSFLLLLHLVEAATWAVLYLLSGDLPDLETAIYFSITSYTTVGYGDVVLAAPWRLLGPIEAAVGILMFGWSTAIIIAAITRIYGKRPSRGTEAEGNENESS
jgi:voltage-gated potassium channel Kch